MDLNDTKNDKTGFNLNASQITVRSFGTSVIEEI